MVESNFQRLVLLITPELAGQRIDKALVTLPEVPTRSQATRLLQAGRIRIDGKVLKPSYLTQAGDSIDVDVPIIVMNELIPFEFALDIPYEDEDLIVVNKPAGLVVHPACGHLQDTLVNALLHHTTDLSMGFNEQRPGLVHRIDKDTSGLLVVAKHEAAQRFLAMQFQNKTSHRLYRAIAFGKFHQSSGTLRSFLRRHPEDRKRMASVAAIADGSRIGSGVGSNVRNGDETVDGTKAGKSAVTHYRVLSDHANGLALVELRLETGRTHQIRVHLSEAGHPIVGDNTYGAQKRIKNLKSTHLRQLVESLPRFALHAAELGFEHPRTHERMIFKAPWPKDLLPLIEISQFPMFNFEHEIERHIAATDPRFAPPKDKL